MIYDQNEFGFGEFRAGRKYILQMHKFESNLYFRDVNDYLEPRIDVNLILSDLKWTYSAQSYSFLKMVADIGGFNCFEDFFHGVFMSLYSATMYRRSLAQ